MSTRIERLYLERVRDERTRREHEVNQLKESERLLEARVAERTAQLADARDHALEASSAKSAFLAHMSHELRTPLSVIIGYADILRMKAAEAGATDDKDELTQIQASAQHILSLVNEVLDMSKIEAGKMTLYLEEIDVCALLTDVAATIQPLVQRNGNTLTIECTPGLGQMLADPTKIRQSLLNLLSNASKFTHNGQIALWGTRDLSSNGHGDSITLSVSDTGPGIPPEKIGGLFEEYMQVGGPTAPGGTGLGLAITRRFCTLMGGNITVASELGKGTTFTIQLPAKVEANGSSTEHKHL
jgi:signal transduction histidine kinase